MKHKHMSWVQVYDFVDDPLFQYSRNQLRLHDTHLTWNTLGIDLERFEYE